jgi:hypothetical protein
MQGWSGPGCGLLKPNWDRVEGAKMNFRMLGHKELGCLKRALGCDMPKNRRGGGGLWKFGPQIALGRKRN